MSKWTELSSTQGLTLPSAGRNLRNSGQFLYLIISSDLKESLLMFASIGD